MLQYNILSCEKYIFSDLTDLNTYFIATIFKIAEKSCSIMAKTVIFKSSREEKRRWPET